MAVTLDNDNKGSFSIDAGSLSNTSTAARLVGTEINSLYKAEFSTSSERLVLTNKESGFIKLKSRAVTHALVKLFKRK